MKWFKCAGTIALYFVVLLTSMSCLGDRYQTFISEEDGPHFSFEYSSRYRVLYNSISSTGAIAILEIQRPVNRQIGFPLIHMDITEDIGGINDAKTIIELKLSELRESTEPNFQIISDSEIVIGGVNTKQIKYLVSWPDGDLNIGAFIVFNYNGLVWYIDILNHEEDKQQEYESLLNHMIETFRFLD